MAHDEGFRSQRTLKQIRADLKFVRNWSDRYALLNERQRKLHDMMLYQLEVELQEELKREKRKGK
jgi:sulfur transfer protein SufE